MSHSLIFKTIHVSFYANIIIHMLDNLQQQVHTSSWLIKDRCCTRCRLNHRPAMSERLGPSLTKEGEKMRSGTHLSSQLSKSTGLRSQNCKEKTPSLWKQQNGISSWSPALFQNKYGGSVQSHLPASKGGEEQVTPKCTTLVYGLF